MRDNGNRTRVLFVSGYADLAGGGQASLLLLLKFLDRDRFIPLLLCPDEGEVADRARTLDVLVHSLHAGPSIDFRAAVRHALSLRRHVGSLGADVVHADTIYTALLCGIGLLRRRVPVIFHARSAESGGVLDSVIPRLSGHIICVSRATASRFTSCPPAQVHVVYNGVDLSEFRPSADRTGLRNRLRITGDSFVVGYAGQLIRPKGLDILIRAFSRLRVEFPTAWLLIVGRGPDETALRRAAGEGVQFLPFSDSMPAFYSTLDVFALPTEFREGLSRSLIESMACAIPSIATPLGGNAETLVDGETGFFIPPRDSQCLHARLRDLFLVPERRRRMGEAARRRAEALFDAAACTRGVEAVYRQVCP